MSRNSYLSITSPTAGTHETRKRKNTASLPKQVFKKPYTPPQTPTSMDTSESCQDSVVYTNLATSENRWALAMQYDELHVDKTANLKLIWDKASYQCYIHHPPKSGKTWFINMAQYFFGLAEDPQDLVAKRTLFNESLLGHVDGGQKFIDDHCGKYIAIRVSFKNIRTDTMEIFYKELVDIFIQLYDQWKFEIKDYKKSIYKLQGKMMLSSLKYSCRLMQEDNELCYQFLISLVQYLYYYFNKQAIIFIDDFDDPIFNAECCHRYEVGKMMKKIINPLFKAEDPQYVKRIFIFGTNSFDLNGTSSSVYFINVHDFAFFANALRVTGDGFQEAFEFTKSEVMSLLGKVIEANYYANERLIDEAITIASKYYSECYAYRDLRLYNQSSIMSYLGTIRDAMVDILSGKCTIESLNNPHPDLTNIYFVDPIVDYRKSKDGDKPKRSSSGPSSDELYRSDLMCRIMLENKCANIESYYPTAGKDISAMLVIFLSNAYYNGYLVSAPNNKIIIPNLVAFDAWIQLLGYSFSKPELICDGLGRLVTCDYAGFSESIRAVFHSGGIKAESGPEWLSYHDLLYAGLMIYGYHLNYFTETETLTGAGNRAIALIPRGNRNTGFMIKLECMSKLQEGAKLEDKLKMLSIEEADHSQNNNGYFHIFNQYEKVVNVTEVVVAFHGKEYSVSVRRFEKTSEGWEYQKLATDAVETLRGSLA
ncbi:hypothetical protein H4219_005724 [Mycoemilia scoparia]|uniref:AAA-ATPase-like domain-containing protein n=1 Tax=Mycoemilia scoparia TaxID=417184 RepID=A0A9W8DJA2_9FUNG|nr:hypothetical protein H4219_005724 [Mycoemilia scoparia]